MNGHLLSRCLHSKPTIPISLIVTSGKIHGRAPVLQNTTRCLCARYLSTHQYSTDSTLLVNNRRCIHQHRPCRASVDVKFQKLKPDFHADCHLPSSHLRTFSSSPHTPLFKCNELQSHRRISSMPEGSILRSQILEDAIPCLIYQQQQRLLHRSSSHHISIFGSSETSAWASAVSEAEKLVGYPTSFMSLRCLLSDELSNVALQARKLVGTKHPLLKTARNFVYDGKHSIQTRGLIVLLVSKAAGRPLAGDNQGSTPERRTTDDNTQGMVSGIYPSQRALAEISEMIHTAFLVHKGVVNLKGLLPADGPLKVMDFGNKMAVLSGDFLLANACTGLAQLRNTKVVDFISQAIGNLTEAAFMTGFAEENGVGVQRQRRRLPYGVGFSDWTKYVYLSSGSLIAQSCKGALALGGHEAEMQERGFEFGKNMALTQQLHREIQSFSSRRGGADGNDFVLMSAPVLLHMEHRTQHQAGSDDDNWKHSRVDVKQLYQEIRASPALEKAQDLRSQYAEKSLDAISPFPDSKAKQALINMVRAVSR